MAEPLKNVYDKIFLNDLADRVAKAQSGFAKQPFVKRVLADCWDELELKARMQRISQCLHASLALDFSAASAVLTDVARDYRADGKTGFEYMFLPDFVEKHGGEHFKVAMQSLGAMTETGSAEFAIRPFILEAESKTMKQMQRWAKDKDLHKRRLASEGCRPRLPWAMALPKFKADPEPILPILEQLRADPSEYVRRSVANNLNDISKDHPELALDIATSWLGANKETDWVVRHACRGLLKAGHPRALKLFGLAPPDHVRVTNLEVSPNPIELGKNLTINFDLISKQTLGLVRLEYGIDFVKANGSRSRKVFKISEAEQGGKTLTVQKIHKLVSITTRVHYPGVHGIAIIVNGVELASGEFELLI